MDAKRLLLGLMVHHQIVDVLTAAGRTYQFSGDSRFSGVFERLFHSDSHPTRRPVGDDEAQMALDSAIEIFFWVENENMSVEMADLETYLSFKEEN